MYFLVAFCESFRLAEHLPRSYSSFVGHKFFRNTSHVCRTNRQKKNHTNLQSSSSAISFFPFNKSTIESFFIYQSSSNLFLSLFLLISIQLLCYIHFCCWCDVRTNNISISVKKRYIEIYLLLTCCDCWTSRTFKCENH